MTWQSCILHMVTRMSLIDLIAGFTMVLVPLLLIGVYIQVNHYYLGPFKSKRRLRKHPLINFRQFDFKLTNNQYYSGYYNKYPMNVGYNWNSISTIAKPCIWIEVFYKRTSVNQDDSGLVKQIHTGHWFSRYKNYYWKNQSIYHEHEFVINPPRFNSLLSDIEAIITLLRKENLSPNNELIQPSSYMQQNWLSLPAYIRKLISLKNKKSK